MYWSTCAKCSGLWHNLLVTNRGKYGTMLWSGVIHQWCMVRAEIVQGGKLRAMVQKIWLLVRVQSCTRSYNVLFLYSSVFQSIVGWCEILGPLNAVMCQIPDIARGPTRYKIVVLYVQWSVLCSTRYFFVCMFRFVNHMDLQCSGAVDGSSGAL